MTFRLPDSREKLECIPGNRDSNWYLSTLFVANMPAEAWDAIKNRQVTPTLSEIVRLAGLTVDGEPPITIDDLMGVTSLAKINKKAEAFYFSGPRHPLLDQLRMSQHYLSVQDFIEEARYIGISEAEAEKYFAHLVEHAFLDEGLETSGEPYQYHGSDPTRIKYIRRFAIRKRFAKQVAEGGYKANLFANSGFIRALVSGTLSREARQPYLQLIAELEELTLLVVDKDDKNRFNWTQTYKDEDSKFVGNIGHDRMYYPLHWLTQSLREEIGVGTDYDKSISIPAFITIANALCPYDSLHKDYLSKGELCPCGVHFGKMNPRAVSTAKNIAKILSSSNYHCAHEDDDINESDPDLENTPLEITSPEFDW